MEFKTTPQKACYEKIAPWVKEIFGDFAIPREDGPVFFIGVGSAVANVAVLPWRDSDAVVTTYSFVVTGAELSQDLLQFLLEESLNVRFGGFAITTDGAIIFKHAIAGSSCDKEELRASVMAVLSSADEYDDKITARWGGQRAVDRRG
jgi:hypothetical protein